jgi:hypothetical protein
MDTCKTPDTMGKSMASILNVAGSNPPEKFFLCQKSITLYHSTSLSVSQKTKSAGFFLVLWKRSTKKKKHDFLKSWFITKINTKGTKEKKLV